MGGRALVKSRASWPAAWAAAAAAVSNTGGGEDGGGAACAFMYRSVHRPSPPPAVAAGEPQGSHPLDCTVVWRGGLPSLVFLLLLCRAAIKGGGRRWGETAEAKGSAQRPSMANHTDHATAPAAAVEAFWDKQMETLAAAPRQRLQTPPLPLRRVKRIMRTDEELRLRKLKLSADCGDVMAKACELFVLDLTTRAYLEKKASRCTLKKDDIAAAVGENTEFDFLIDFMPQHEIKRRKRESANVAYMPSYHPSPPSSRASTTVTPQQGQSLQQHHQQQPAEYRQAHPQQQLSYHQYQHLYHEQQPEQEPRQHRRAPQQHQLQQQQQQEKDSENPELRFPTDYGYTSISPGSLYASSSFPYADAMPQWMPPQYQTFDATGLPPSAPSMMQFPSGGELVLQHGPHQALLVHPAFALHDHTQDYGHMPPPQPLNEQHMHGHDLSHMHLHDEPGLQRYDEEHNRHDALHVQHGLPLQHENERHMPPHDQSDHATSHAH